MTTGDFWLSGDVPPAMIVAFAIFTLVLQLIPEGDTYDWSKIQNYDTYDLVEAKKS